jgi:hypothetical protein
VTLAQMLTLAAAITDFAGAAAAWATAAIALYAIWDDSMPPPARRPVGG